MTTDPALPPDPGPVFSDGAWAVLAALGRNAGPEELAEAKRVQAEDFKARFGCYLHEMLEACPACPESMPGEQAAQCPIWLPLREELRVEFDREDGLMPLREQLDALHRVAEIPCVTCGGSKCNIFFCYEEC